MLLFLLRRETCPCIEFEEYYVTILDNVSFSLLMVFARSLN